MEKGSNNRKNARSRANMAEAIKTKKSVHQEEEGREIGSDIIRLSIRVDEWGSIGPLDTKRQNRKRYTNGPASLATECLG